MESGLVVVLMRFDAIHDINISLIQPKTRKLRYNPPLTNHVLEISTSSPRGPALPSLLLLAFSNTYYGTVQVL